MKYEITGAVYAVYETQEYSNFRKREFVLQVEDGKYPQLVKLEVHQDKVTLLDGINEGDSLTVSFNLRGKEHNGRVYTNLVAWRIDVAGQQQQQPEPVPRQQQQQPRPQPARRPPPVADDEEVPF